MKNKSAAGYGRCIDAALHEISEHLRAEKLMCRYNRDTWYVHGKWLYTKSQRRLNKLLGLNIINKRFAKNRFYAKRNNIKR